MSDDFESAVESVSQEDDKASAPSFIKKKVYPLPDQGRHRGVILSHTERENKKYGSMMASFAIELDSKYTDEDTGDEMNHRIFYGVGLATTTRSRLYKFFFMLTGQPLDLILQETTQGGAKGWLIYPATLVGCVAEFTVVINPSEDGTREFANVDAVLCTKEEQKKNLATVKKNAKKLIPEESE